MSLVRRVARLLLASSFIVSGLNRLKDPDSTVYIAKAVNIAASTPQLSILRGQEKLVGQVLAGTQVAAGGLFALGKLPRLSSAVLLGAGITNAYIEYRAADATTKEGRAARRREALSNGSLLGAIAIAAVDTDGSPSLAWRANKMTEKAAKKSSQLTAEVQAKTEDFLNR